MTRRRTPSRTVSHPAQSDFLAMLDGADLIEVPQAPSEEKGAMDYDRAVRDCLNRVIDAAPFDREQIAAMLTLRVGRRITKAMLDTYTGASRPNKLPADLLPALSAILGPELLIMIGAAAGCAVLEQRQATFARLGQLQFIIAQAREQQLVVMESLPLMRGMAHA